MVVSKRLRYVLKISESYDRTLLFNVGVYVNKNTIRIDILTDFKPYIFGLAT